MSCQISLLVVKLAILMRSQYGIVYLVFQVPNWNLLHIPNWTVHVCTHAACCLHCFWHCCCLKCASIPWTSILMQLLHIMMFAMSCSCIKCLFTPQKTVLMQLLHSIKILHSIYFNLYFSSMDNQSYAATLCFLSFHS